MRPIVLTFAASDPTGGAGMQADLLTLAALGCHPLSVLTALTVQDTRGVEHVEPVSAEVVGRQAGALRAETQVAAFKVGVVASAENARAIASIAGAHAQVPLVLDPVLASGRGDALASEVVVRSLLEHLVPRASVVTPNILEEKRLGGAKRMLEIGCRYGLRSGTNARRTAVTNRHNDG